MILEKQKNPASRIKNILLHISMTEHRKMQTT